MKFFKLEIIDINNKKHIEFVSAEDKLQAMDKTYEKYKNIKDIKII